MEAFPDSDPETYKYWAFIRYSQQDNLPVRGDSSGDHIQWANWLHEQLETFRIPDGYRDRTAHQPRPRRADSRRPRVLRPLALRGCGTAPLPPARPRRPYPHPHRGRRAQRPPTPQVRPDRRRRRHL